MDIPILSTDSDQSNSQQLVKDTTTEDFKADVLDASQDTLVLVDFWAPWCGPCRQLTPVLEKLVKQAAGAVKLVKMNIDDHPAVASQLGVQSIPAVFAFKDGRPVDGFMGALPESQIKSFMERHAGQGAIGALDEMVLQAEKAFNEQDYHTAAQIYADVLKEDRTNIDTIAGLAQCYIAAGEFERAEEILKLVPPEKSSANSVMSAQASLELSRKGADANSIEPFKESLEKNPDDYQSRFDLALALNAKGQKEEAMEQLFHIIERNRNWNDGEAQQQMVQLFAAWGADDKNTVEGRRRLSSLLFA